MLLTILEVLFWLFLGLFLLFGVVLGMMATTIARAFEPRLLLSGVWLGALGLYLMPRRVPDDSPFVGLADAIAQSHIIGVSTPKAMLIGAAVLVAVSAAVALRRRS